MQVRNLAYMIKNNEAFKNILKENEKEDFID